MWEFLSAMRFRVALTNSLLTRSNKTYHFARETMNYDENIKLIHNMCNIRKVRAGVDYVTNLKIEPKVWVQHHFACGAFHRRCDGRHLRFLVLAGI
jgi:hypothetical protein